MGRPLAATVLAVLVIGAWFSGAITSTATLQSGELSPNAAPAAANSGDIGVVGATQGPVPQAEPTWIAIGPDILGRTLLNPDGIRAVDGALIPTDDRPVFRVDSNQPGTDSPGTSFIIGHNYASAAGDFVPFSTLERVALGHSVFVGTPNGTLVYAVEQVLRVPKDQIASRTDLLENVPGRLILETCDTTVEGKDTWDNLVVITQLVT